MRNGIIMIKRSSARKYNLIVTKLQVREPKQLISATGIKIPDISNFDSILVRRERGGLGDFIMLSGAIQKLQEITGKEVALKTLIEYSYLNPGFKIFSEFDDVEENFDVVIEVGHPCPAAAYEAKHCPNIEFNRTQIFGVSIGLTDDESKTIKPKLIAGKVKLEHPVLGIQLYAAERWRDWSLKEIKKFLKQASKIVNTILIFGNTDLRIRKSQIIPHMPLNRIADLINSCDVFVAPDSGLMHLALALDVKTICLFGPTDGKVRTNCYSSAIVVQGKCKKGGLCWYKTCLEKTKIQPCMKAIKPNLILKILKDILN